MPLYLEDLDMASKLEGHRNALIIPCYMCPAATVAVKENKPFLQFFSSFLKSPPFESYIKLLQDQLGQMGINSRVFKSYLIHHWFLCLWPESRRRKLKRQIRAYDAAIVLGCDSATATIRDVLDEADCEVFQGMEVAGFMNAKLKLAWPGTVSFDDCRIIPLSAQKKE
jgi:hypothetical protein